MCTFGWITKHANGLPSPWFDFIFEETKKNIFTKTIQGTKIYQTHKTQLQKESYFSYHMAFLARPIFFSKIIPGPDFVFWIELL